MLREDQQLEFENWSCCVEGWQQKDPQDLQDGEGSIETIIAVQNAADPGKDGSIETPGNGRLRPREDVE